MRKILISIIMMMVAISSCGIVFAENGETPNVTLNMTNEFATTTEATSVTIKLGYGIVEGLEEGVLVSFKGKLKYDTSIFSEVKVEGLNGYTATYAPETQRIVLDPKEPQASTEIANITFTLADGVEQCSTSVNFEIEEFTDGTNDFDFTNKEATIKIEKPETTEPTDDENNTDLTSPETDNTGDVNNNTDSTQETNTEQTNTNSTDTTIDKDQTPGKENQNLSNEEQKISDPTTAKESIPKTGSLSFKIILALFIIVGIISIVKFKKIEIE